MNFSNKLCLCIATLISLSSFGMIRQIIRDENGFRVFDGQQEQAVKPHFVDPLLKRMSPEQLKIFVEQGNRIRAIRLSNGEHRLLAMIPGKGGGLFGASLGFWIGKGTIEVLGHGTIAVISFCAGPIAGPGVAAGLEATFAPVIEATSNAVGLGLGLAGGVATGPV